MKQKETLGSYLRMFFWAALIALVVRSFIFQPFNIPSGSMKPTLLVGDFLFVSKYSYGVSRHSMPFSPPIFDGRIFSRTPKRGDVVVFKLPTDGRTDYIKRIIGLGGDKIQIRNGVVWLNDKPLPKKQVADFTEDGENIPRYQETLPNGKRYFVLDENPNHLLDNTGVYNVPAGHYFMMGDNRDNSTDSRVTRYVGYVPHENLVGPARALFFSLGDNTRFWQVWRWISSIRFDRIFTSIK